MSNISVVIPTLWLSGILPQIIGTLESCPEIDRIIIIDNDPKRRLTIRGSKLTIIANSKNIYVNPAWNRAVSLCLGDLVCFLNDDVLPSAELFKYVRDLFSTDSKQKIGMVGLNWSWPNGNIEFTPVGWRTSNWFGSAWFIRKIHYSKVPLAKIWGGEDWNMCKQLNRKTGIFEVSGFLSPNVNHQGSTTINALGGLSGRISWILRYDKYVWMFVLKPMLHFDAFACRIRRWLAH